MYTPKKVALKNPIMCYGHSAYYCFCFCFILGDLSPFGKFRSLQGYGMWDRWMTVGLGEVDIALATSPWRHRPGELALPLPVHEETGTIQPASASNFRGGGGGGNPHMHRGQRPPGPD